MPASVKIIVVVWKKYFFHFEKKTAQFHNKVIAHQISSMHGIRLHKLYHSSTSVSLHLLLDINSTDFVKKKNISSRQHSAY